MSLLVRKCIHPALHMHAKCLQSCITTAGCCPKFLLIRPVGNLDILTNSRKNRRTLHTSRLNYQMDYKKNKSVDEKRKDKNKVKVAYIKPGMSSTQLAQRLSVGQDEVLTSLELVTNITYEPDQAINDIDILQKVCDMLERQYKIVNDKKGGTTKQSNTEKHTQTVKPHDADILKQPSADVKSLVPRSPVVTIMGHVDHGKTTLLDALRESSIVDKEFGGITQHVGAFVVKLRSGHSITFLDTPGHQAFSAMRARGASVTDIIILVIAAEDGIMPQTIESIQHAKSANVPIIVAINKIDKHPDGINKIKNMLAAHDVVAEDYGGDVQIVPISALKRINLDKLEESVITLAEFLELKADPGGLVEGSIIETRTDIGHGKMATILVQRGTLKKGAYLISGTTWTRVRAMYDSNGQQIDEAAPSIAVEVSGWKEFPAVGDDVLQTESQKKLTKAVEYRLEQVRVEKVENERPMIDEKRKEEREIYVRKREEKYEFFKSRSFKNIKKTSIRDAEHLMNRGFLPENEVLEVTRPRYHIIIKGDVAGSVEAILDTLATFRSEVCDIDILHSGVGNVSQYDIELAELFQGEVYAFNVDISASAKSTSNSVPVKHHNVIYHLFNDLMDSISRQLPTKMVEEIIGEAEVMQTFTVSQKVGGKKLLIPVAGCCCVSGNLERKHLFKVVRGDEVIVKGDHVASLKHHKEEVSNIVTQQECGIQFHMKDSQTLEAGDTVICYQVVEKKIELDWKPDFADT